MGSPETVVIDSDILIDHLRGFLPAKVYLTLIEQQEKRGFISAITVMELLSGKTAADKEKYHRILKLLSLFEIVNVSFEIADKAGEIRRKYNTNPMDSLIAATALIQNKYLITCNIKHYKHIKELRLLQPYNKGNEY